MKINLLQKEVGDVISDMCKHGANRRNKKKLGKLIIKHNIPSTVFAGAVPPEVLNDAYAKAKKSLNIKEVKQTTSGKEVLDA